MYGAATVDPRAAPSQIGPFYRLGRRYLSTRHLLRPANWNVRRILRASDKCLPVSQPQQRVHLTKLWNAFLIGS